MPPRNSSGRSGGGRPSPSRSSGRSPNRAPSRSHSAHGARAPRHNPRPPRHGGAPRPRRFYGGGYRSCGLPAFVGICIVLFILFQIIR